MPISTRQEIRGSVSGQGCDGTPICRIASLNHTNDTLADTELHVVTSRLKSLGDCEILTATRTAIQYCWPPRTSSLNWIGNVDTKVKDAKMSDDKGQQLMTAGLPTTTPETSHPKSLTICHTTIAEEKATKASASHDETTEKPITIDIPQTTAIPSPGQKDTDVVVAPALPDQATASSSSPSDRPVLALTLLLPTGGRHSFKITESYLTKQGVSIEKGEGGVGVYGINIYQLKELILREWREAWSGKEGENGPQKPNSPAAIRLIFFGRLLGDGDKVDDCRFNKEAANVVHMTVRPQDVLDEEEAEKKRAETGRGSTRRRASRGADDAEPSPGCRCIVQ